MFDGCRKFLPLQCAHIVSRAYLKTRWDPRNAVSLCGFHHVYFTHRGLEWEEWVDENIGTDTFIELKHLGRDGVLEGWKPGSRGVPDYEEIIEWLSELIAHPKLDQKPPW